MARGLSDAGPATGPQKAEGVRAGAARGYVLSDAFRLWCNLKRGRIASYMDEKRRLERYVITLSVAVSSTK